MCANPFDCDYAAYGGRIERLDRTHGRVGSAFTPEVGTDTRYAPESTEVEWLPEEATRDESNETTTQGEPSTPGAADELDWDLNQGSDDLAPPDEPPRGTAPLLEDAPPLDIETISQ
jgi:hypothetical protein